MARFDPDTVGHFTKRGQLCVFNAGVVGTITAVEGSQAWSSISLLKQSLDAALFSAVLSDENGTTTANNWTQPYNIGHLNSWKDGRFKIVREDTEFLFTNVYNSSASVDMYVLRTRHPIETPSAFITGSLVTTRAVYAVRSNTAGANLTYSTTDATDLRFNLYNCAALWKYFSLIEQRHFNLKPGGIRRENFNCRNEWVSPAWNANAVDTPSLTAVCAPGEYFLLIRVKGCKLQDANNVPGTTKAAVKYQYRNQIVWQRPTPYNKVRQIIWASTDSLSTAAKFKKVHEEDTDLSNAAAKVMVGNWQSGV